MKLKLQCISVVFSISHDAPNELYLYKIVRVAYCYHLQGLSGRSEFWLWFIPHI